MGRAYYHYTTTPQQTCRLPLPILLCGTNTQVKDPGTCLVCRNTISLQESNSLHEISLATQKFSSIDVLCKAVGSVNFEAIKEQLDSVEIVDSRIKHLLIDEESIKVQIKRQKVIENTVVGLQEQITSLHDQLKDISSHPPSQCHANVSEELIQAVTNKLDELQADEPRVVGRLEGLQTSVERLEQTTLTGVQGQMTSIHDELRALSSRPQREISTLNKEFMDTITDLLRALCAEEPKFVEKLDGLKASVEKLEQAVAQSQTLASDQQRIQINEENAVMEEPKFDQSPIHSTKDDYVTDDLGNKLNQLFGEREGDFEAENGRLVLYFGEQYKYTGSTASNSPHQAVPLILGSLIKKINTDFCAGESPKINSCLVNWYEGSEQRYLAYNLRLVKEIFGLRARE